MFNNLLKIFLIFYFRIFISKKIFDKAYHMNQSRDLNMQHILIRNESIVSLLIDGELRVCLSQLSSTLLFKFSYNEIHNRRVALGINCVQCSPRELEILRANGAMPVNSRRCVSAQKI